MPERKRIVLADDHTLLLEAFELLLAPDYDVVAKVRDGNELLRVAHELAPDVAVVDISMPGLNGIDACERIRRELPGVGVVILTVDASPQMAAEAFRVGASGYVVKSGTGEDLGTAIRAALRGERFLSAEVAGGDPEALPRGARMPRWSDLSPRERQVAELASDGHTMKEVAAILGVGRRTAEFYKYRAMRTLGVETSAELFQIAQRNRAR
ncbi:MAG TPA: response regulator transcription factor [Anaeromyxobacteraceae bacterium]|nr:response regulator transcription factor [Anaeromyxobacteraceae bacterium]